MGVMVGGVGRVVRKALGDARFYTFVVGCLAVGIGMSTAVFTVADAVLLRPLAYPEAERLAYAQATLPGPDGVPQRYFVSPANFIEMRDRNRSFESLAATWAESYDLVTEPEPVRLSGARATTDLFRTLGVRPLFGRVFDERDSGRPVVLVTASVWRRYLGEEVAPVGRSLRLDGVPREVVGVVPDAQAFPTGAEVWIPWRPEDATPSEQHGGGLQVVGRLLPETEWVVAQSDMNEVARGLQDLYPANNGGRGIEVGELRVPFVSGVRGGLLAVTAAVLVFLLATVVNVAGLFLVRAGHRTRLVAVRSALGASSGRIVREALGEGMLIAGVAALLGAALAWWLVPLLTESLVTLPPGGVPALGDVRVLGFSVLVTTLTAVACAAAPAWYGTRVAPASALRQGVRGGTHGKGHRRLQGGVVMGQTLLGVVLVLAAAAAGDRLVSLLSIDPGFGRAPALSLRVPVSDARFPTFEERAGFVLSLASALSEVPGVRHAGGTDVLPVGDPNVNWALSVESRPPADPSSFEVARGRLVTPGYLEAASIAVVRGRSILPSDRMDSEPVVVVSERFAERYWSGEDPIGRRIKRRTWNSPFPWMTVVGVVADVRDGGPAAELGATVYLPYAQHDTRLGREISWVVQSDVAASQLLPELRARIRALDPPAPVVRVQTLDGLLAEATGPERTVGRIVGGFALGGLLLLALGAYGVMSRTVLERKQEVGLRRALGARRGEVVALVLRSGGVLLGAGLAGGIVVGPTLVSWSRALLGVELSVPNWGYPLAIALVLGVGMVASLLPALRAARVSPMTALVGE